MDAFRKIAEVFHLALPVVFISSGGPAPKLPLLLGRFYLQVQVVPLENIVYT